MSAETAPTRSDLWQQAAQLAELLQQPGNIPTETILGFLEIQHAQHEQRVDALKDRIAELALKGAR